MLKAVLFDLDHTLIDWEAAEPWETFQPQRLARVLAYVQQHLAPLPDVDAATFFETYREALVAAWKNGNQTLRAPDIAQVLADTLRAEGVPDDQLAMDGVLDAYDWQLAPGERAFPDVPEVLPELDRHGLGLGIVTNASHPMEWRDRELHALDLLDWFPTCRVAAVDVGYLKPHQAIFRHALGLLDIQPDEAVFVGDNLEADIRGAQDTGMAAVWRPRVASGAPGEVPEAANGIVPDGTITTLHDLLPLLDAWYPRWRNGHRP